LPAEALTREGGIAEEDKPKAWSPEPKAWGRSVRGGRLGRLDDQHLDWRAFDCQLQPEL